MLDVFCVLLANITSLFFKYASTTITQQTKLIKQQQSKCLESQSCNLNSYYDIIFLSKKYKLVLRNTEQVFMALFTNVKYKHNCNFHNTKPKVVTLHYLLMQNINTTAIFITRSLVTLHYLLMQNINTTAISITRSLSSYITLITNAEYNMTATSTTHTLIVTFVNAKYKHNCNFHKFTTSISYKV